MLGPHPRKRRRAERAGPGGEQRIFVGSRSIRRLSRISGSAAMGSTSSARRQPERRALRRDENRAKVVDVRQRRPGHDEIAERGENGIGVVVGEPFPGVEAERGGARERIGRDDRAGIVLAAVDAVGVAGDRVDLLARRRARPRGRAETRRCARRARSRAP